MKYLQYGQAQRNWLLKSPLYFTSLKTLLDVYPGARVIQTHRDPIKSMASTIDGGRAITSIFRASEIISDVDRKNYIQSSLDYYEKNLRDVIKQRENNIIPKSQIFDFHFQRLVDDPVSSIRTIYKHFDLSFSSQFENDIVAYLKKNPRYKHGKPTYDSSVFGIPESQVRDKFDFYMNYYSVAKNI